jgi:hypothetical protein
VVLGGGIDVASVEVYSVGIHSVVSPRHSVGVEDREQVENETVTK